jgi:hypothetical protein
MMIGYARVSTDEQNLALQLDALRSAGCEVIFEDTGSGADDSRKGLTDALSRSTPRLKPAKARTKDQPSRASGINASAKPRPCTRPNTKATAKRCHTRPSASMFSTEPASDVADRKEHALVGRALAEVRRDLEVSVGDQRHDDAADARSAHLAESVAGRLPEAADAAAAR